MTRAAMLTLSVVIVSFNTRETTLRCLADLYCDARGIETEVVVVDNGSTDGSVQAIRAAFPAVTVIAAGENLGFGAANNLAFARTTGEFVLLLNTDAFLKPGAIGALLGALRGSPGTAVVGPRLLNSDGSLQMSCYKFPSPLRSWCENTLLTAAFPRHPWLGDYRAWAHDSPREVDFVIGACMLVRRTAMDHVGYFDERFFMYSEESDWCRRFRDAGWLVGFVPGAEVVHLNGGSGKQQPARVFNEFRRSAEMYVRKHHGALGVASYRMSMALGACVRIGLFAPLTPLPRLGVRARKVVGLWWRILIWQLGIRGAGLKPAPGVDRLRPVRA